MASKQANLLDYFSEERDEHSADNTDYNRDHDKGEISLEKPKPRISNSPPDLTPLEREIWDILAGSKAALSARRIAELMGVKDDEIEGKISAIRKAANSMEARGLISRWALRCPDGVLRVYYASRKRGQSGLHRVMVYWVSQTLEKYPSIYWELLNEKYVPDFKMVLPDGTSVAVEVETGLKRHYSNLVTMVKNRLTRDGYDHVLVVVPDQPERRAHSEALGHLIDVTVIELGDLDSWIREKISLNSPDA